MRRVLLALLSASLIAGSPSSALAQDVTARTWEDAGDITPRDQRAGALDIEWSYDGVATAVWSAPLDSGVGLFQNDRRFERFLAPVQLGGPKARAVFDVSRDTGLGAPFVAWAESASIGGGSTILTALRTIESQRGNPTMLAAADGEVLEVRGAGRLPRAAAAWRERTSGGRELIRFAETDDAGTPQQPITLATGEGFKDLIVATSFDDRVLVLWTDEDGRAWISRRPPRSARFRAPLALTPRGSKVVGRKHLWYLSGDPYRIAWVEKRSGSPARVAAVRGELNEADVSRVVFPSVSRRGVGASDVQLTDGGTRIGAIVAWRDRGAGGASYLRMATARDSRAWSVKTAARGGGSGLRIFQELDEISLFWLERRDGVRVRQVRRAGNGRWGRVKAISPREVTGFDIGRSRIGNAADVVWTRGGRVEAAVVDRGKRLSLTLLGRYRVFEELPSDPHVMESGEFATGVWWRVDAIGEGAGGRRWWHAAADDFNIEPAG